MLGNKSHKSNSNFFSFSLAIAKSYVSNRNVDLKGRMYFLKAISYNISFTVSPKGWDWWACHPFLTLQRICNEGSSLI